MLGVQVDEAAAQGVVETLAALQAVRAWSMCVSGKNAEIEVRSDSVVALAVMGKLANATPALNFLGAELALELELGGVLGLRCSHLPGKLNGCADYLSRLHAPCPVTTVPAELKDVTIKDIKPRELSWFRLPPPGTNPGLWGEKAGLSILAGAC